MNEKNRKGIIARLRSRLGKTRSGFTSRVRALLRSGKIDEDVFEELEATLIQADIGVQTTMELIDKMRERVKTDKLTPERAPVGPIRDADDYRRRFPDGRIGSNPALASVEIGRELYEAAVQDVAEDYRRFLDAE